MKKIKTLLGLVIGYIVTSIVKVFGQSEQGKFFGPSEEFQYNPHVVMGLPSPPPQPTLIEQIVRISGQVIMVVAPIIGVWIFLKKAAKKQPPMSTMKKILLSIAIFLWIFIIAWFLCSLILRLVQYLPFSNK